MWQAEADAELTLSASPATAVGQSKLYPGESRLESQMHLYIEPLQTRLAGLTKDASVCKQHLKYVSEGYLCTGIHVLGIIYILDTAFCTSD